AHQWQVVALEGRFEDLPVHGAPLSHPFPSTDPEETRCA
ncbi:MAG: hypothetical protein QOJ60_3024, partial [Actinomycetota bacterium]|nr:hypothetical protein [Actinomycetota bacterium]